ncbi:MAG: DNA repair protein RecO [Bacteroidetes bacterium]|nr:DNA repair protein RecO [Bacteroidota bacterium]
MISTTKGIVFHQIKYSETSLILKIYTENFGLQSYIAKGARSKKSKISPSVLQHLSLIELVANHKEKNSLSFLKEIRSDYQYSSIPYNVYKSSILIFVNELVYRSIREEEKNQELFNFLTSAIQWLDLSESRFSNFHLVFAIQLSRYLGFYPKNNHSKLNCHFNLQEGIFTNILPRHENYLDDAVAKQFSQLIEASYEKMSLVALNNNSRNVLLERIIEYYQLHLPNFGKIKSLEVLRTVLS